MPPRDDASLIDMLNACTWIMRLTDSMESFAFYEDKPNQFAVLHQLLILGEAVKRLSSGFRQLHPDIDWRNIAGTRDKLIHEYDTVDIEEVWKMATRDVPALRLYLQTLIPPQT